MRKAFHLSHILLHRHGFDIRLGKDSVYVCLPRRTCFYFGRYGRRGETWAFTRFIHGFVFSHRSVSHLNHQYLVEKQDTNHHPQGV